MDDYKKKLIRGSEPAKGTLPVTSSSSILAEKSLKKPSSDGTPKLSEKEPLLPSKSRTNPRDSLDGIYRDVLSDLRSEIQTEIEIKLQSYQKDHRRADEQRFRIVFILLGSLGLLFLLALGGIGYSVFVKAKSDEAYGRSEVGKQIMLKLDQELQQIPLREIVEKRARDYVDSEAPKHVPQKLQASVDSFFTDMSRLIDQTKRESAQALENLNSVSSFVLLIHQAKNDDRIAFDKILETSHTRGSSYQAIAKTAISQIFSDVSRAENAKVKLPDPWSGKSLAELPYEDFKKIYQQAIPLYRPSLLWELYNHPMYTSYQKLSFLADVIRNDSSLKALYTACKLVDQVAGLNKPFTAYSSYLDWWTQNKSKIGHAPS
ncbi:MAG: hypothetical protein NC930_08460 [Candidatus Omnitrophica bacterium]|nr:hypothetical protein [Candidatus Omnitrophota bacterium]